MSAGAVAGQLACCCDSTPLPPLNQGSCHTLPGGPPPLNCNGIIVPGCVSTVVVNASWTMGTTLGYAAAQSGGPFCKTFAIPPAPVVVQQGISGTVGTYLYPNGGAVIWTWTDPGQGVSYDIKVVQVRLVCQGDAPALVIVVWAAVFSGTNVGAGPGGSIGMSLRQSDGCMKGFYAKDPGYPNGIPNGCEWAQQNIAANPQNPSPWAVWIWVADIAEAVVS